MAKLYFRYSTMAAGKSLDLLKVAFNYKEKNQEVLLFTSHHDDRYGKGLIKSRLGIEQEAIVVTDKTDLYKYVSDLNEWPDCILFDEAQFLTKKQVFLSKKLHKKRLTHFYDKKLGIAQRLLQFDIY